MRLLISGSKLNTNTIASFIIDNFGESLTYEMLHYPDAYSKHLKNKLYRIINHFFPIFLTRKMDNLLLKQVEEFKPTVILIFKGMEISDWSLKKIRKKGIKLVNYNFDHPFDFFSKGTGNKNVRNAIPYYDLHISYSSFIAKELADKFNVRTVWIPFAFHISEKQYDETLKLNLPEIERVAFVGNPDSHRIDFIKRLLADGVPVDVFGFGWEQSIESHPLLTIHPPRRGGSFWGDPLEFWTTLRRYRVQLNFFRPHNQGSHNLRTFEVPGVGGILLTPASKEQADFFAEGTEIFFYEDYASLLRQCKLLLGEKTEVINQYRAKARARSLSMDYSYKRRTKDLLTLLADL